MCPFNLKEESEDCTPVPSFKCPQWRLPKRPSAASELAPIPSPSDPHQSPCPGCPMHWIFSRECLSFLRTVSSLLKGTLAQRALPLPKVPPLGGSVIKKKKKRFCFLWTEDCSQDACLARLALASGAWAVVQTSLQGKLCREPLHHSLHGRALPPASKASSGRK